MTRKEAIKHLKLMQSGARNAIRFKKNDKKISEEERKEDIEIYQDQLAALKIATNALEQEPKIKVLDCDEVIRKLGAVDIYPASAWVTLFKDVEHLGLKICEVEQLNRLLEMQESILDKIRAEIMDTGAYEQEVNGRTGFLEGINYCLNVIDKYKAESEE